MPHDVYSLALLAVVEHDGVVVAAGNDGLAEGAEVEAVDFVRVFAEHLRHAEAPQHVVRQLHAAAAAAAARTEGSGRAYRSGKRKAGDGRGEAASGEKRGEGSRNGGRPS